MVIMSDIFQFVLSLFIILGVCGVILGLMILVIPFVAPYVEAYWDWANDRFNKREDSKNERD